MEDDYNYSEHMAEIAELATGIRRISPAQALDFYEEEIAQIVQVASFTQSWNTDKVWNTIVEMAADDGYTIDEDDNFNYDKELTNFYVCTEK